MGGSDQWHLQREPLGEICPLVPIDLPGFGRNAGLAAPECIVDFANWVLDQLTERGFERFHLLGHSMGGMIVQEMTAQAPSRVAKLVLYGTGPHGSMPGRFETLDASARRAAQEGPEAAANRISATWFLHGEQDPQYAGCAEIARRSTAQSQRAGFTAMNGWDGADHLRHILSETLVIWGQDDRAYPWAQVEELWRGIPNSHLAVLPGCSHAVHLEQPIEFNSVVARFLATDWPTPSD